MIVRTVTSAVWRSSFSLVAALAFGSLPASATTVDLMPGAGSSGTVNGTLFAFDDQQPLGTGFVDAFLRIQNNGTEEGYNTSNPSPPFDEIPPPGGFTRDLQFGELVDIGGSFGFFLDINEPNGGGAALLSLDALQIYVSATGSQNTTVLGDLGTLIYDLDAGGDSVVLMDFMNAPGSGVSDMLMSVPSSIFAGVADSDFVILYSRFGDTNSSQDGFEEWYAVIPEPGTGLLVALSLTGLGLARRRR